MSYIWTSYISVQIKSKPIKNFIQCLRDKSNKNENKNFDIFVTEELELTCVDQLTTASGFYNSVIQFNQLDEYVF